MASAPMMVRLSPSEREDFEAKAARARLNRSDAARAALAAWQPEGGEANAIRYQDSGGSGTDNAEPERIRVEYDDNG